MFAKSATFSTLMLLATVTYAMPSPYTSVNLRDVDKRMVTCEQIFWLKDSTSKQIFNGEDQGPRGEAIALSPNVHNIFQRAWYDSFPTPTTAQETGGWVFADPKNPTRIAICRAANGRSMPLNQDSDQYGKDTHPSINLESLENNPSEIPENMVVVANFHTHPMPWTNSNCASSSDSKNAWARGVPGIIIHRRGMCVYGPDARERLDTVGYPESNLEYNTQKTEDNLINSWIPKKAQYQNDDLA